MQWIQHMVLVFPWSDWSFPLSIELVVLPWWSNSDCTQAHKLNRFVTSICYSIRILTRKNSGLSPPSMTKGCKTGTVFHLSWFDPAKSKCWVRMCCAVIAVCMSACTSSTCGYSTHFIVVDTRHLWQTTFLLAVWFWGLQNNWYKTSHAHNIYTIYITRYN